MTPELRKALADIAAHGRVEAETTRQRAITDVLFELGFLNISPPGWCYSVNSVGHAELAKGGPAPDPMFEDIPEPSPAPTPAAAAQSVAA